MLDSDFVYQPAFIQGGQGNLFTFGCWPSDTQKQRKQGILLIPPFAEEMNKSRRMLIQQAKQLAQQGYAALLVDLFGTGDSEGDFKDATWECWCDDISVAHRWLTDQGVEKVSAIGLRTGALLLADMLAQKSIELETLVLWQPVIEGSQFLNQFFRLRLAAEMSAEGQEKLSIGQIKQELSDQGSTEIAGYTITQNLVETMSQKSLLAMVSNVPSQLHWCEVMQASGRPLTVATQKAVDKLAEAGVNVNLHKIRGYPFWGASGVEDVPALHETTCQVFSQ